MRALVLMFAACLVLTVTHASAAEDPYRALFLKALETLKNAPPTPFTRTTHPEALWFPKAGFGLFMHWGIHSVAGFQPSWAMIEG
jgi:alpha-L-fucosidase